MGEQRSVPGDVGTIPTGTGTLAEASSVSRAALRASLVLSGLWDLESMSD